MCTVLILILNLLILNSDKPVQEMWEPGLFIPSYGIINSKVGCEFIETFPLSYGKLTTSLRLETWFNDFKPLIPRRLMMHLKKWKYVSCWSWPGVQWEVKHVHIFFSLRRREKKNAVALSGAFFICIIILLVTYKTIMTINKWSEKPRTKTWKDEDEKCRECMSSWFHLFIHLIRFDIKNFLWT